MKGSTLYSFAIFLILCFIFRKQIYKIGKGKLESFSLPIVLQIAHDWLCEVLG